MTGQIVSTRANNTANGQGQIYLNATDGNRIDFNGFGIAAPSFTTRSAGTKIVLYPAVAGAATDYAIGMESNTMWNSVPTSTSQYKWYAGTTPVATLSGTGDLSLTGSLTALNISYKPWHVAGRYDGVNMTLLSNKGEYPFTVSRVSGQTTGFYQISWTQPHPDGANYVACCSGEGGGWNDLVNGIGTGIPTPTSTLMTVAFRKLWQGGQAGQSEGLVDCSFSFFILK